MSLVTLADVKALGRIDFDDHDALLDLLIEEAEAFVEEYCEIKLSEIATVDELTFGGGNAITVKNKPITSVDSVKDGFDDDDVVDEDLYFFSPTLVIAQDNGTWASGAMRFKVSYTAGYTASTAPAGLKTCIREMVLLAYNNPESKERQAAAGYGTNWRSLADGNDITTKLDYYSLRRYAE